MGKIRQYCSDQGGKRLPTGFSFTFLQTTSRRVFRISISEEFWYKVENREFINENQFLKKHIKITKRCITEMNDLHLTIVGTTGDAKVKSRKRIQYFWDVSLCKIYKDHFQGIYTKYLDLAVKLA